MPTALGIARHIVVAAWTLLAVLALSVGTAQAANPYAVGDTIVNPLTGADETVQELAGDDMVVTDLGSAIYVGSTTIGDKIEDPDNTGTFLTIIGVHTNDTTNLIDSVTVKDDASPPNQKDIALVYAPDLTVPDNGDPGNGGGSVDVPVPTGNTNVFVDKRVGARGSDGHDGGGIRICIIWCFTIGVNASAGSPGGQGSTIIDTVSGPDITTVSPGLPGAWVSSLGGNGGQGGDAYGINIPAGQGGAAGRGGDVTVTTNVNITTAGDQAYGIFAQSRAGAGGAGGSGYILSSGAGGGPAAQGGSVVATNNGTITTFGAGASGMMVQSLGGGGGSGGDSYGIVGVAGSASQGGHGGNATAINNGTVTTRGVGASGVVAQSIGGSGGDGGASGGIGAVGGTGDTGGNGGQATIVNSAAGEITTNNSHSFGILAQSIGGGGGTGGAAGGIAGIGGSGQGGGSGGKVTVTNDGHVTTTGLDAHAIVAQSIGGGGGTGASAGGAVAVGGNGGAAGNGGIVVVDSSGVILTRGVDSKGILAQSIGGGGGSASASGGVVSLGGKGGSGGNGGTVTVTNSGQITTLEQGSDGVLAQSIGGGGGDGGSSGGLVSLGGSGTAGGTGSTVTVTNTGSISTSGARARGVLAQSIGGGGGNGGDSGGLVSLGGSGSVASNGGSVTVTNSGTISTIGNVASAIEAESIGGGGGSGGTSGGVFFTLGGTGGGGGNAGTVTVNNSRNLSTTGDDSHGVFAQSVGGGGGNGGNSASGSAFVGVAIGGKGGAGGAGSEVTINSSGQTIMVGGAPVVVTPLIQTEGDRAKGIFAQSVGGGGGNGGFAAQATVGYIASASVAVGGTGGDGGDGGTVRVNGDSTILTDGFDSDGMLVQSVGGGGGNGGFAVSFSGAAGDAAGIALGVGVGGKGGKGGSGGNVYLDAGGDILTEGAQSEGLIAQSVGGGGGTGGFSVTIAAAGSGGVAGAVSVGVGGSGGDGGGAGTVNATYAGNVVTKGDDSNAMLIQGVGGGGGNGGFSVSGAVSGAASASGAVAVGVGGSGGGGGAGGIVTANVTGDIGTMGDRSSGLVAQSIGGRGGNGAFNVSGTITGSGGVSGAVSVGVGGSGGGAGDGREVNATFTGDAATLGGDSDAVLVQSVGGGGGNGAFNVSGGISASAEGSVGVAVGVGGAGGDGGSGGTVTAHATGDLETLGAKSNAFIAQSLGGGGGNGGFNVSGSIAAAGGPSGAISVGVGGSGGGGGDGSTVNATVTGSATTHGADATAIIAQSVGGGGGTGGMNVSGSIAAAKGAGGALAVGVGGSGGGGGVGGQATLTVAGDVKTEGDGASGVLVQSLGGGGGAGGINVSGGVSLSTGSGGALAVGVGGAGGDGGASGAVNATLEGDVTTLGDNAAAFTAQSIGGGGGAGGLNVSGSVSLTKSTGGSISVGVGGFGGGGGTASTVVANVTGTVDTAGAKSTGVLAQSVGGGGGNGGLNVSGALGLSTETGVAVAIGVGGFGGDGGTGAAVTLNRTGTTTTSGASSDAVVAQSLGGGGGNGGINISGGIAASSGKNAFTATIGVGGFGGDGGTAGDVIASVTGDVLATGLGLDHYVLEDGIWQRERRDGSNAILAQSLGGGGGNGGLNVSGGIAFAPPSSGESNALNIGVGGFGGTGGNAGTVTLHVDADTVSAIGDERFAVGAQSIGGGGGNGGLNVSGGIVLDGQVTAGVGGFGGGGGTAGAVNVTSNADLYAAGSSAIGLLAQSVGGGGGKGGINISGGLQPWNTSKSASLVFGLGGFGGPGNTSSSVTATQTGSITVEGADSIGILVQSVAGGGGVGGLNVSGSGGGGKGYAAAVGVGGSGGAGANAGAVSLVSDGLISVDGREPLNPDTATTPEQREALNFRERANGILVQSIGGGGGTGGMNVTGVIAPFGSPIAAGVGGTGGGGGDAGAVNVTRGLNSPSLIQTIGRDANGLTAQSIGGGGGNAGMNFVVEVSGLSANSGSKQALFAVGGGGGDPGHGSTVDVTHVGDISTDGHQSDGILAQSVGGGGGNATYNIGFGLNRDAKGLNLAVGGAPGEGGDGAKVTVEHTGDIVTRQDDSTAIFAQSVGGGGGNAGLDIAMSILGKGSLDIGVGRMGGTGGTGGNVTVTSDGTLVTLGDRSVGVLAQSVGNGGGKSGSYSFGLSAKSTSGEGEQQTTESGKISVKVGIEGGAGGTAGSVDVSTSGSIATAGKESHAIQAQSVGGGGGIGGAAMNFVLSNTQALNVGVGGEGGTGGTSGVVNVDNSATIETLGDGAHGIYAQSIGGGGGVGGYAGVAELNFFGAAVKEGSHTLAVSVGGSGGVGAAGNSVIVDNFGSILTHGAKSYGISAQSIGGGGGDGGLVLDASIVSGKETTSLRVNVGGSGGSGAVGKDVTVTNEGNIHTIGKDSIGIRAESLGGGGGDAGLVGNLRISGSGGEATAGSLILNIGGVGGTGGAGGNVSVTNRQSAEGTGGYLLTEGESAYAIFAQSLGGGGGNGSSILSANLAGGKGSALVGVNIGGTGGTGGTAGTVTVINEAAIETLGDKAHGVFAQSIGGGGGNGGLVIAGEAVFAKGGNEATPLIALGGSGGTGDDAGAVIVNNSGNILTRGGGAHGIYAQSIGGGGGNAGIGVGLTSGIASNVIGGVVSALFGGRGGEGGLGGTVEVHQSGDITVLGDNSQAVVAESINGGGGHVALDFQGITTLPGGEALPGAPEGTDTKPVFVFNGGGSDTQDSDASRVTLDYTGTFGAAGRNGAANAAQSIGGGGGTYSLSLGLLAGAGGGQAADLQGTLGGANGRNNDGGDVDGSQVGDLVTTGANTPGLFLQSIGGGGGRASLDVSAEIGTLGSAGLTLGGTNGTNERGGGVAHAQTGSIVTTGAAADGALLQSIGGGGGLVTYLLQQEQPGAGNAVAVAQSEEKRAASDATAAAGGDGSTSVTLGGNGGSGLDGGAVSFKIEGDIATGGDHAQGLVLQSIGAGGGKVTVLGTSGLDVLIGGSAGASGNGADLDVSNTGDVSTSGTRSHGVILQSIGGGGGAVFTDTAAPDVAISSANAGNGGAISFAQVGDIVTTGAESYGLLAQSIGGGGGFVDGAFKGSAGGVGAGGAITLTIDGDLVAMGDGSTALLAQSAGSSGGGDLSAVLTSGHHLVGGTSGIAVEFDGGAHNVFENHGSVMTLSGATGMAFVGGAGDEMILNRGVVLGNVDLGAGANVFVNHAGATFYAGETVDLGAADNLLVQDALLAPGAGNLAVVTQLSGSLRQSAGAISDFELDFRSDAIDSVIASGTIDLGGTVNVSLLNTGAIKSGSFEKVLYYGAGGLTDSGLALFAQPSIVIDYDLVYPDAMTAALAYDVDFAPAGLVGNRIAIGNYLNRVQAAGSTEEIGDTITALVLQTELGPYSRMLTELGPEFYAEQQALALGSVQRFAQVMQDCGSFLHWRIPNAEPRCAWFRFDYESSSKDAQDGFPSTDEIARRFSMGYQQPLDDGWTVGVGFDFEHNNSAGFSGWWQGETTNVQLGFLGRRAFGATSIGAVLLLSNSDQDVNRRVAVTGETIADGSRNVPFFSGVFDVAHRFDLRGVGITPALDLGVSGMFGESMKEVGAGAQNVVLDERSETHSWVEPSIAVDYASSLADDKLLRMYARLGVLYYLTDDTTDVRGGLQGAPAGVQTMLVGTDLDGTHFDAEAGLEFVAPGRYSLSLSYEKQTSDIRDSNAGSVRLTIPIR